MRRPVIAVTITALAVVMVVVAVVAGLLRSVTPTQGELETLAALVEQVSEPAERARLEAERLRLLDERARLVTGLVPPLVTLTVGFAAAAFAWRTSARERGLTRSAQLSERFTRAVDQLGRAGGDHLDVRLGGIYALEQITKDDLAEGEPVYPGTVAELLTAFVRGHAPWPPEDTTVGVDAPSAETVATEVAGARSARPAEPKQTPELQVPAADVQAAMTVLGRPPEGRQPDRLDLHGVDLRRGNLMKAHLEDVFLANANLEGAYLRGANLQRADLANANLEGADLRGANLEYAYLGDANLQRADLINANLQDAYLGDANLQRADLRGANLQRADLINANLQDAYLGGANLQDAYLGGANLQGVADLRGANLQRARAQGTSWPEDFYHPTFFGVIVEGDEPVLRSHAAWRKRNLGTLQLQAVIWDYTGRQRSLLLTGEVLEKAERWAAGVRLTLTEREFLDACRAARAERKRR